MANVIKNVAVLGAAAVAGLYLINPTAGVLEFIPDVVPLIGNLDEAAAVTILIGAARYYGIDISNIFRRDDEPPTRIDDTQKPKRQPPR